MSFAQIPKGSFAHPVFYKIRGLTLGVYGDEGGDYPRYQIGNSQAYFLTADDKAEPVGPETGSHAAAYHEAKRHFAKLFATGLVVHRWGPEELEVYPSAEWLRRFGKNAAKQEKKVKQASGGAIVRISATRFEIAGTSKWFSTRAKAEAFIHR